MKERWKVVPGYGGSYMVSDQGRVWSATRKGRKQGRLLCLCPNTFRYLKVLLCKNGTEKSMPVHNLVLLAFKGPIPHGLERLHLNDVKTDNRLVNLRYGTRSDNANGPTKVRAVVRGDGKVFPSIRAAVKDPESNVGESTICNCCRGRYKTAGGWKWRYQEDVDTTNAN